MGETLAVLNAGGPGAWLRVGGIPLVARALYHLRDAGVDRALLITGAAGVICDLDPWRGAVALAPTPAGEDLASTIAAALGPEDRVLYVDAGHLIDPRLLRRLAEARETTLLHLDSTDRETAAVRAALLTREGLRTWVEGGAARLLRHSRAFFPASLDPFCPVSRGPRVPYLTEVRTPEQARQATRLLVRNQQKQVMDLPAEFLDPPLENALTVFLCSTPITPDAVTFLVLATAAGVGWLFWHAHFLAGAIGMFAVEILDGVDGKLARTKLRFSRLGRHEDVLDYLYENSWYVCLGVGLGTLHSAPLPALLAAVLILSDTADNLFYTVAGRRHGKSIDLFSPFDRAFRRVAGRRNIYGILFLAGFALGYPLTAFGIAALWAAVTAGVHGFRLHQFGRSKHLPAAPSALGRG